MATILTAHRTPPFVHVRGEGSRAVGMLLGEGGEGAVHELDTQRVVKLYRPDRLTESAVQKLAHMVATPIRDVRIAWPQALVEDGRGRVLGYVMARATGRTLRGSVFDPRTLATTLPRWSRVELVSLALTLIDAFDVLHQHGVLAGDIHGGNVMVGENPCLAQLVDLDSCQIGPFRSPVGTPPFLAPRLMGKQLDATTRTIEDECFAIATLLFMVLMLGKSPYSQQGGGDPIDNVLGGRFPYEVDGAGGGLVPLGPWGAIWAGMPLPIREIFVRVFARHLPVRLSVWKAAMTTYHHALLCGQDDTAMLPGTRSQPALRAPSMTASHVRYFVDQQTPFMSTVTTPPPGPASPTHAAPTSFVVGLPPCVDCYGEIRISDTYARGLLARGRRLPRRCWDCHEAQRNQPSTFHTCVDCPAMYEVKPSEARFFTDRGLTIPKRCFVCRKLKKRY
jgi:serine/threonine protein kinase